MKGIRIIGISDSIASPIADCCSPFFMVPQVRHLWIVRCGHVADTFDTRVWMRDRKR